MVRRSSFAGLAREEGKPKGRPPADVEREGGHVGPPLPSAGATAIWPRRTRRCVEALHAEFGAEAEVAEDFVAGEEADEVAVGHDGELGAVGFVHGLEGG